MQKEKIFYEKDSSFIHHYALMPDCFYNGSADRRIRADFTESSGVFHLSQTVWKLCHAVAGIS